LSQKALKEAFQLTALSDGSEYPYGWIIEDNKKTVNRVNHSGGWPGYETLLFRYLDEDKTIIFLNSKLQGVQ
jgi:hypothetical protein